MSAPQVTKRDFRNAAAILRRFPLYTEAIRLAELFELVGADEENCTRYTWCVLPDGHPGPHTGEVGGGRGSYVDWAP